MVDLFADGLQVALLGETSQQSLHTIVELVFAIKLERKREQRLKNWKLGDKYIEKKLVDIKQCLVQISFADDYCWDCPTQRHYMFVSRLQSVKEGTME